MKNNHSKYYVYMLAGAYLVYLAYQITRGLSAGEENGYPAIWLGIAAAAFVICGSLLVLWSFRKVFLHKENQDGHNLSMSGKDGEKETGE